MRKRKKRLKLGRLLLLLICIILILNLGNIARRIYPAKHTEHIKQYSAMYQVDPYLIMSIIKAESNFDAAAVSQKNATGLMQIISPTAIWLAERMKLENFEYEDIKDPELNIQMGCYYVSYLLSLYNGNTDTALAAYNAGEGTVDGWLANKEYSQDGKNLSYIPYPETRHYITKVNNNQKVYKALYKLSENDSK